MKKIILLLLLSLVPKLQLFAQVEKIDSVELKTELAAADAKHFKLDKRVLKAFRKRHFAYTSDYFKPTIANVSNPKLLSDSIYVKAFKIAAQHKTLKRRTIGHYILVAGAIYAGIKVVLTIAFLAIGF